MEPYDAEHLEEVFERVLDQIYAPAEWKAVVEYGDLVVGAREVERGLTVYRGGLDLEVPLHFAARSVVAQSRPCEVNAYTKSQEEIARLKNPDPSDPDGMGAVIVFTTQQLIYSWRVNTIMCFANRRLRDGSCLAIKVAVDRRADGVWSTRRYLEKSFALSYWHVRATPAGCHLSYSWQEKATLPIVRFFAPSLVRQLCARSAALNIVGFQRVILSDVAAAGGGAGAARGAPASGRARSPRGARRRRRASAPAWAPRSSARTPRPSWSSRRGGALGALAGRPPRPHPRCARPGRLAPCRPPRRPLAVSAQVIEEDCRTAPDPVGATQFGEAVRASMDLSVHLERLYVSGAAVPPSSPAPSSAASTSASAPSPSGSSLWSPAGLAIPSGPSTPLSDPAPGPGPGPSPGPGPGPGPGPVAGPGSRPRGALPREAPGVGEPKARARRCSELDDPPPSSQPPPRARPTRPPPTPPRPGRGRTPGPAPGRRPRRTAPTRRPRGAGRQGPRPAPAAAPPLSPQLPRLRHRRPGPRPSPPEPAPTCAAPPRPPRAPPLPAPPASRAQADGGRRPPDQIFEGPEVFKADCSVLPAPASQQPPPARRGSGAAPAPERGPWHGLLAPGGT
eukprot:tig00001033_g6487.t1